MTIAIYHNPACGTSGNVLAMIRQSGEEPVVGRHRVFEDPADTRAPEGNDQRDGNSGSRPPAQKGTPYAELGLGDPKWTDDQLLDFVMAHPILINRPIVVARKGSSSVVHPRQCSTSCQTPTSGGFLKKTGRSSLRDQTVSDCPGIAGLQGI